MINELKARHQAQIDAGAYPTASPQEFECLGENTAFVTARRWMTGNEPEPDRIVGEYAMWDVRVVADA